MAFCPHALKAAKKRRTPSTHGENSSKKDDGVDADAALAGPVGIGLEVKPEGKLVQGKRRADAVAYGHESAEEDGQGRMRTAEVEQPAVADEQQNQNSPDKVMDVAAVHDDPVEWAVVVDDEADEQTHAEEGDKKRHRGDEHAAAGPVWDGGADEKAQASELQEHEQHHNYQAGEGEQQERTCSGHALLNHLHRG